jgi:hypothetical protein
LQERMKRNEFDLLRKRIAYPLNKDLFTLHSLSDIRSKLEAILSMGCLSRDVTWKCCLSRDVTWKCCLSRDVTWKCCLSRDVTAICVLVRLPE